MGVYRNYYSRKRPLGWALSFCVLYLVCSSVAEGGRRPRHRHHQAAASTAAAGGGDGGDVYVDQLERSRIEDASARTPSCPNCLYKHGEGRSDLKSEADGLRLEAIKRQILSKLGMRHKPNVTYSLPREVLMETLSRAEDGGDFGGDNVATTSSRTSASSAAAGVHDTMDFDDFYGRTSEIISFAEQGSRVNQNRLLEFRVSPESGQAGQEFRVRTATLWLKADFGSRHRRPSQCRATEIYVFKIISRLPESVTLSSQDFDRAASDPVSLSLQEHSSGWQKLDLTDMVKKWLADPAKDKLRLFVDCSCCSHWHLHLFNGGGAAPPKNDPNRPFLVVHTDPNTAKRVRRRALDCAADSGNQCCKQRFYVSFKQLGWDDWVIAPQGYYANYCRGDCGHHRTPDTYVTYHTHVIEEVRKTHHLSGMQPCCAPLKFSSMSLIYYGPDLTIIKRDLPKMVVDECGCP